MSYGNGDDGERSWYKVAAIDELPEGRVKTVVAGHRSLALTHFEGRFGALDNRCPQQGGPLGEGSIENGWLRCPWKRWLRAHGDPVERRDQLDEALTTALAHRGPSLVEVIADHDLV